MTTTTKTPERAGLTWEEVCNGPYLRDLPYKIETNEYGQIVMSQLPPLQQGARRVEVGALLDQCLPDGQVVTGAPIRTSKGTKVASVVWMTSALWTEVQNEADIPIAAQICVEVLAPRNSVAEIDEKKRLYLETGAEEVWTCDRDGNIRFFDASGELEASKRAPEFPRKVEI